MQLGSVRRWYDHVKTMQFELLLTMLDLITKNREPTEIPRRYYLLLARYYVEHPERANELLQTCLPLWNNAYFQIIFPLLFHEWVCIDNSYNSWNSVNSSSSFFIIAIMTRNLASKGSLYSLKDQTSSFGWIWRMARSGFIISGWYAIFLMQHWFKKLTDSISS